MPARAHRLLRVRSTIEPACRAAAALMAFASFLYASSTRAGINTWTSNGPAGGSILTLAIDPHTSSTLYAGTRACVAGADGTFNCTGNLFKSTDGGTNWTTSSTGLPNSPVVGVLAIDPRTPTTLYAGTDGPGGLFKSTDAGASWTPTGAATPIALAIDPDTPSTLYAGVAGSGVIKSTDGGSTWVTINPSPGNYTVVTALAIDPTTPSTLYAGSVYGAGYALKTIDGGSTWDTADMGLSSGVGTFAIDPTMPDTVYATSYYRDGVFKSTDGGESWLGLDVDADLLAVDPLTPSTLYAGGDGVFKSTDGGASWQTFNIGLTNHDVLAFGIGRGTLYAGTADGVFAIQTATFSVNSTGGAPDASPSDGVCATADGACTLRAAIDEANALPGGSTINVPAGIYPGGLRIDVDLSLRGAGAASTRIDGGGPVLQVSSGARVDIHDVRIENGHANRNGGGIVNDGDLALTQVTISGNTAESGESPPAYGGGVYNAGTLTLTDVTISDNTVGPGIGPPAYGGGLYNAGGAALRNVTVSGNTAHTRAGSATWGGGIYNSGTLTATNSTISGNEATEDNRAMGRGGGIYNDGSATLISVTIGGNSANAATDAGGGIFNGGPTSSVTLHDTLVADSAVGGNCSGTIGSLGHNLDSDGTCGLAAAGDLSNTDPKLGPLQDNGGPTFTQALLPGSPAIGAGSPDCPPPATDQRGVPRTPPCDIGAYEAAASSPEATPTSTATPTEKAPSTVTATPTQTPTLRACIGDCTGRYTVAISDLVTLVNVALGSVQSSACPHGLPSGTDVTIALIIQAVNNALSGCP